MGLNKKKKYILLKALKFGKEKLGVKTPFTLKMSEKRDGFKTTGYYDSENLIIAAYIKDRAICDIIRSVLHELVHKKQHEDGRINGTEPDIGGEIEDEANSLAGSMVKAFSYELREKEKIDIYDV